MSLARSFAQRSDQIRAFPRLEQQGARRAAVALAIVPTPEGHGLVLTERTRTMRHHAGQYALPGGLSEPGEDSVTTALRETHEEIGVPVQEWTVLGQLDDYVTARGTVISPVVMSAQRALAFTASPDEVESIILIPIDQPRAAMEWVPGDLQPFDRPGAEAAKAITVNGHMLFAPTGAVVFQFLELWEHGRVVRVHDIGEPVFATH